MNEKLNFINLLPSPSVISIPGGGDFEVRGLSLEEVSRLLKDHLQTLMGYLDGDVVNFQQLAIGAPELVAKIIGIASGVEEQEEVIKLLPLQIQLEALIEVWKLTVPDIKKLKGLLSDAVAALESVKDKGQEKSKPLGKV